MVSTSILEHIFEGVNGDSVYRGASFLAGKLGQKIAGDNVNIIDDGTMAGGFGTQSVRRRRRSDAAHGRDRERRAEVLSAQHLHREEAWPADHRQRFARTGGNAGHRAGKLFSAAGSQDVRRRLIAGIKEGLYVTEFLGHGREPGDRRLFARGLGDVDLRRENWRIRWKRSRWREI